MWENNSFACRGRNLFSFYASSKFCSIQNWIQNGIVFNRNHFLLSLLSSRSHERKDRRIKVRNRKTGTTSIISNTSSYFIRDSITFSMENGKMKIGWRTTNRRKYIISSILVVIGVQGPTKTTQTRYICLLVWLWFHSETAPYLSNKNTVRCAQKFISK